MKLTLCFMILLTLNATTTWANEITLRSSDRKSSLSSMPQSIMALFVDQGFKQTETSPGVFDLTVSNIRCDLNNRSFLFPDDRKAGLSTVKCFFNTTNEMHTSGKKILEGRHLVHLFSEIEKVQSEFQIKDCAAGGKCSLFVTKIQCQIDLNQELMSNAYQCQINF